MAATQHAQNIKRDSREYLTTALLQLLATKDLNEISVTAVVRRAGVSRMAFYRNFETLTDLLTAYFEPQITARFADLINQVDPATKLAAIGTYFAEFAPTMRLAQQRGFEFVIRDCFSRQMAHFYHTLLAETSLTPVQQKYWVTFMSAGVYAIWREWLQTDQQESLETLHTLLATFQKATYQALQGKS